jgi:hypothetical protein
MFTNQRLFCDFYSIIKELVTFSVPTNSFGSQPNHFVTEAAA